MVQFFKFIIASMLFSTDVLPNMEDVRYFKIFIPALEYFSGELRVVLYLGDLNIIHTWKQGNIYWVRPMVTHCVPWLGSFTWAKECHSWNVTISSPECDVGRQSESITQSQAKLYEQHVHLSGFLIFILNILQRTRINIEEQNTWFLTSWFRFVHLSFLLISAFLCGVICSCSNDSILVPLLLVEEPAQAVTQNYHKLELAPRPARECSDVKISSQYHEQIKENSETGCSMYLP